MLDEDFDNVLDVDFDSHVDNVVKKIFPNLIIGDVQTIMSVLNKLLNYMYYKFGFDYTNEEEFYTLMKQNNNQHIKSILKLLLPYIDDSNEFKLFEHIEELSDIVLKKKPGYENNDVDNPYMISTYQYTIFDTENNKKQDYTGTILSMNMHLLYQTIELSRSKLQVNWIDILPITRIDYKESRLYKKSCKYIDGKLMFDDIRFKQPIYTDTDLMFTYGGISAYDMFNAVHVFLFNEIYNSGVKWLMYEKQTIKNNRPKTYIEILNDVVNISHLDNAFTTLTSKQITEITDNWLILRTNTDSIYKNFIKCVMFKFDLNYCTAEIEEEYGYDSKEFYKQYKRSKLDDEDTFLDMDKINIDTTEYEAKVNEFFRIPFEHIFNFFFQQVTKFKRTWYGKQMITNEGTITTVININSDFEPSLNVNGNTYFLTYKNIYNYAKAISLQVTEQHNIVNAMCLSDKMWETFFNILNNDVNIKFNMPNVMKKTYGDESLRHLNAYQSFIKTNFMKTFIDNVFIIYISLGLLSEIVPCPYLSDKELLGPEEGREKVLIQRMKNKFITNRENLNKYLDTEYYVTREKYRNLELYKGRDGVNDDTKINWFQHLTMGKPWYNYFALSLVSQLNFNHHFLNNRVIMVTGSTGQGKSVVVPILFYYASIALNLNSKSKVLSTQALVGATLSNSKFMARNMGVPIDINGYETNNSYIQYSTQSDKHLVTGSETFIKEVTDRTLLEELLNNPILKRPKSDKTGKKSNEYTNENLYDIIIIDEAHMHNTSMDLILTIIKNAVMINNQIKLVITSATMDNDEFIYRRFYKYINDNYIFPLNPIIFTNITNRTMIADRRSVDRRFHISPPGESNRFEVKDIYLNNDTDSYEEAEREGVRKVLDILPSTSGDILFFTITTPTVLALTKELNEKTPSDVIVLPLYSKLRDYTKDRDWFATIQDIHKTLPSIVYRKEDIVDVIETGVEGFATIPKGTYKRAIVIATNVVEASVTIESLKYVIDTGYANVVSYDIIQGKNVQSIEKIAEASRIQRRGRVGRVSSGTAFYMYAKETRAHIKPEYGLVSDDISFDIFKMLSSDGVNLLYDMKNHPQNFEFTSDNHQEYLEFLSSESNETVKNIYLTQYEYQFKTNVELDHPFLDTNTLHLDKDLEKKFPITYVDGFGTYDLFDVKGEFYVIHPGEKFIERDSLTGDIKKDYGSHPGLFSINHTDKIMFSYHKMQYLKYIYFECKNFKINYRTVDKMVKKHFYISLINDVIRDENENLATISKNFTEEEMVKFIKTIFMSRIFNCINDVLKVLSLLYSMGDYKSFIRKQDENPKFLMTKEFIKKWNHPTSELIAYKNIMDVFISDDIIIEKQVKFDDRKIDQRYKEYEQLLSEHGSSIFANSSKIDSSGLSKKEIKLFTESKNRRYDSRKRNEKFTEMAQDVLIENESLDMQCRNCFVDKIVIQKALKLYNKLRKILVKDKFTTSMDVFADIYTVIKPTTDCIIMSFLENYGFNIVKNDGRLYNILTDMDIVKPKVSLVRMFNSYYFFTINSDMGPIGMTCISVEMIQKTFAVNSMHQEYISRERRLLDSSKPETITSTATVINPKNLKYDMSNIIISDLKKM